MPPRPSRASSPWRAPDQSPVLATAGTTTDYHAAAAPRVVDGSITLGDRDDPGLASATVSIATGLAPGDTLALAPSAAAGRHRLVLGPAGGVLTLTSPSQAATLAQWQTALRSVTFSSSSTSAGGRTIRFSASDGRKAERDRRRHDHARRRPADHRHAAELTLPGRRDAGHRLGPLRRAHHGRQRGRRGPRAARRVPRRGAGGADPSLELGRRLDHEPDGHRAAQHRHAADDHPGPTAASRSPRSRRRSSSTSPPTASASPPTRSTACTGSGSRASPSPICRPARATAGT